MKIGQAIQQGEVYIKRIAELPEDPGDAVTKGEKGFILSHSERGHHHILEDGELIQRPKREGLDRFYAILNNPSKVIQDASNPHGDHDLPPGIYDIRISREYNPFIKEARRVVD